jgi:ATP-dependent Clp protease ATP-binding subunit ClpB
MAVHGTSTPFFRGQEPRRNRGAVHAKKGPNGSEQAHPDVRQAVTDAQAIARRLNHNEVETWHLLSALLGQENGIVPGLVDKLGLTASALQLAVDRELERLPKVTGSVDTSKVYVTQAVNDVLTKAEKEAKSLKDEFVSVEHLFLGLIEVGQARRAEEALQELRPRPRQGPGP